MPKMPVYNSQRSLTTDLAAPIKEGSAQEVTAMSPIVDAASQIHQKWNEAVDNMQETAVKLSYEQAQAQAETNSMNDADINGEKKQIDFLKKTSEEALKGVTNKYLQNKLKLQLDHAQSMSAIKIKGIYAKKKIFADNIKTEALLDQYAKTGGSESDKDALDLLQSKVASGLYTDEQGKALLKKYRINSAKYMMMSNPSFVREELQKPDGGYYKDIPIDERNKLYDQASDLEERRNIELSLLREQAKNTEEMELVDLFDKGQLTPDLIEQKQNIDTKFRQIMSKAITSPKAFRAETDLMIYEDLFTSVLKRDKKPGELRRDILQANVSGKLSMTDARRLLYIQKDEMGIATVYEDYLTEQENTLKELNKTNKKRPNQGSFWKIAKEIAHTTGNPLFTLASIIDRVRGENVTGEQIVDIAKDEARKQILKENPLFSKLPKTGFLHEDRFGNKAIVYPDGTYEEVQASSGEFIHKEQRKRK